MSGFLLGAVAFVVACIALKLRRRWMRMIQCQHLYAETIYGDEIIAANFRRGWCPDCAASLNGIPYSASARHKPPADHQLVIPELRR